MPKQFNVTIPIEKLQLNPKNLRDDYETDIEKLTKSLLLLGQLHNLIIDENYIVLSGNRRLIAMKLLGWKSARCDIYSNLKEHINGAVSISANTLQLKNNVWKHREKIAYYYWESFLNSYTKKNINDKGYTEFGELLGLNYRTIKRIIESVDYTGNTWITEFKKIGMSPGIIDCVLDSRLENRNETLEFIKNEYISNNNIGVREMRDKVRDYNRLLTEDNLGYIREQIYDRLKTQLKKALNKFPKTIISHMDSNQQYEIKNMLKMKLKEFERLK